MLGENLVFRLTLLFLQFPTNGSSPTTYRIYSFGGCDHTTINLSNFYLLTDILNDTTDESDTLFTQLFLYKIHISKPYIIIDYHLKKLPEILGDYHYHLNT